MRKTYKWMPDYEENGKWIQEAIKTAEKEDKDLKR